MSKSKELRENIKAHLQGLSLSDTLVFTSLINQLDNVDLTSLVINVLPNSQTQTQIARGIIQENQVITLLIQKKLNREKSFDEELEEIDVEIEEEVLNLEGQVENIINSFWNSSFDDYVFESLTINSIDLEKLTQGVFVVQLDLNFVGEASI